MFYDLQSKSQQESYKRMLKIMGQLSRLFSDGHVPFLHYRCHENIFCKYFDAKNLGREDCSADAQKGKIGIGLKTWMGADAQKVAEFDKEKNRYTPLQLLEMIREIAVYRNTRIAVTKRMHGISEMVYHVVKRVPHAMQIYECAFDPIDIPNIKLDEKSTKQSANNIYFSDGKHKYHFSTSKSTLYMHFDDMTLLDSFDVDILDDPYVQLEKLFCENQLPVTDLDNIIGPVATKNQICLRLYSIDKSTKRKFVPLKSGLNQWNADGRKRNPNEIYIPYPREDQKKHEGFFPARDTPFELTLPDGTVLSAKVCQQNDKAIMSNPNSALGKWLLRDVLDLPENKLIDYEMLWVFGIDSVVFTKIADLKYEIDFTDIGTYERFNNPDASVDEDYE